MLSRALRKADVGIGEWCYEHRRPERPLLYQFVAEHYLRFVDLVAAGRRSLPEYMHRYRAVLKTKFEVNVSLPQGEETMANGKWPSTIKEP